MKTIMRGMFVQLYLNQTTSTINNLAASPWFFPSELKVAERDNLIQRAQRRLKYSLRLFIYF